jgi:hypothetical protein
LLNVERERERQRKRWCRWRDGLPAALQQKAGGSWTWKSDGPLAFGKLTLEAQLEVLSHDAEKIRQSSGRWNSMLEDWRRSISAGTLSHAILDPSKQSNLSVDSYAKAFWELADSCLVFPNARASDAHRHGMAASVCADDQYPMLWESDPSSH